MNWSANKVKIMIYGLAVTFGIENNLNDSKINYF